MGDTYWVAATTAFWLGILTAISPCPLATNIAAISYIGKRAGRPRYVLATGSLYTLGRSLAYVILGALLVTSLLSIPRLSNFLQIYMNKVLGPVLIIAGMFLVDLLKAPNVGGAVSGKVQERFGRSGMWGAALLGLLFALSFCPISAALFFGSLIPLSLKWQSGFLLPLIYGIGTAIPVFGFAVLMALGTQWIGSAFHRLTAIEVWARRVTGIVFIAVGVYLSLTFIFGISVG